MKKRLLALLSIIAVCSKSNAQLFTQNFETSTTVADYISASAPNSGQFSSISNNTTGLATSITNGGLRIVRSATGGIYIYRNFAFTTSPTFVQLKFDFTLSANDLNKTGLFNVMFGNAFTNTLNGPNATHASSYVSRIGINTGTVAGDFRIGTIDAIPTQITSGVYSGTQTITYVLNKSDMQRSYTAPNTASEDLAKDAVDVWIGTTRIINDFPLINMQSATNPVPLDVNGFKIQAATTSGLGTFDFDNISFTDLLGTAVLPVNLSAFTGKAVSNGVQLNWSTTEEINNSHFEVLRSSNGINFNSIGTIKGKNSTDGNDYQFVDNGANSGTNYYQLKQFDKDGKSQLHKTIVVNYNGTNSNKIRLLASSTNEIRLSITVSKSSSGLLRLTDVDGRTIYQSNNDFRLGENIVSIPTNNSSNKIFIAQFMSETEKLSLKIFK